MFKMLFKYKWYILIILALIIIEPTLDSILNFWLQRLFNSAKVGTELTVILQLLTIGFLLWILKRLIIYSSGVLKSRFICNVKRDVKHNIFASLFKLNTAQVSAKAAGGEYISLFTNDITILETRFFNQLISLISGIFSVVILGSSLAALEWRLAVAILGFGLVSMIVPAFFSKPLNKKNLMFSNAQSDFTQSVKEYVTAYPTIKNYSVEKGIIGRFDCVNNNSEDAKFDSESSLTLANNVGQLLAWFMQFMAVGVGLVLVVKGEIIIGTVVAAQAFASDLAMPLQNIIININSIRSIKYIVKKIETMSDAGIAASPEKAVTEHKNTVDTSEKFDIRFQNLGLEIAGNKIIDDFTFDFKTGKKYLMVGLNGAGKSSIFCALKKYYDNYTGTISVNDVDIATVDNKQISEVVSYMNENVAMFSGSVEDNITLFRDAPGSDFSRAVTEAKVGIGLERIMNDDGRNISSGERRRIEIARSLLGNAKVLILDEVVSTLDIETAYEIEKIVLEFKDKTAIFISHNFSRKLVREYDEILVIDKGRLVSHGKFDDLIKTCPYFRRICDIKFGEIDRLGETGGAE